MARSSLGEVRASLLSGRQDKAAASLRPARDAASRAHRLTDGPVWAVAAALPWVGDVAGTSRGLAADADRLVSGPVTTLVETADTVRPHRLWSHGRVAVKPLRRAAGPLTRASREMAALRRDVAALPAHTLVGAVDRARTDFLDQLTGISGSVADAARMARVAPGMFGADGPRRYLLVFQNSAESRGTGGILGAFGVLETRDGKARVVRMGPSTDLEPLATPARHLDRQYRTLYDGFGVGRQWQQANPSPHFPSAARTWLAMWHRQTGRRLDGVIATDPVALGYLLRATGPVRLPSGQRISGGNAVTVTLKDAYAEITDNAARDAYFQQIAHAVLAKALAGHGDPAAIVEQLGRAAGEGRLLVFSAHHRAEAELARTALGGVLPDRPGPFAEVVVNNIAGSKLDYYLARSVRYTAVGGCSDGSRRTRVRVRLTNTAPAGGLPSYVVNHVPPGSGPLAPTTNRLLVTVFLARGASMDAVRVDGRRQLAGTGLERGHTVVTMQLDIPAGRTRTLVVDATEPASSGASAAPVVPVQPLVRPQHTSVHVPPC